jgi:mevalonate kinase
MNTSCFEFEFFVPAKCMLFGEYGVLVGGSALVVTLPEFQFHFRSKIDRNFANSIETSKPEVGVTLISEFFSAPQFVSWAALLSESISKTEWNTHCAATFLIPLQEILQGQAIETLPNLTIEVVESFSPNLGFGSSSAIFSASIAIALFIQQKNQHVFCLQNFLNSAQQAVSTKPTWYKVINALHCLQGKGSGYDIAAQLFTLNAIRIVEQTIFMFSPLEASVLKPFQNLNSLNLGSLWSTPVYAPTTKLLSADKTALSEAVKSKVREFEKNLTSNLNTAETFQKCFREHVILGQDFGLMRSLPTELSSQDTFFQICSALLAHGVIFKTTGAGCGDSLWILSNEDLVTEIPWKKFGFSHCPIVQIVFLSLNALHVPAPKAEKFGNPNNV